VEIQVRTSLQHLWAELSEKVADVFDPLIKYGGGDSVTIALISRLSAAIDDAELKEWQMSLADKVLSGLSAHRGTLSRSRQAELDAFLKEQRGWRKKLNSCKKTIRDTLEEFDCRA
jgi:ppGpp synthetase/RelA/SpoT-type nucleotidyltranferase